ncbi:soluble starch synthase 1, chloroplastic/amyloplastic-like [Dioscorea cayenensis subsp. rotundata]|uniref:Soluble starch synthase 1, chloroplastic/amyloplastic-like n=1 Tax=Dioscorea cayennensis subsp. rotundata TaxID=55577 RepID=A0AB40B1V9_DIOCR|nr:soluble starch synthase 1, chloroplastic/amyloplastic-like [Dioscorea cayenensis subsp. rotundata]
MDTKLTTSSTTSVTFMSEIPRLHIGFPVLNASIRPFQDNPPSGIHGSGSPTLGIANDINVDIWNPVSNKLILFNYFVDGLHGKIHLALKIQSLCKAALQKNLRLAVRPRSPFITFIARLDYQNGTILILSAMPEILQDDVQFIMLGSRDPLAENLMRQTESCYGYYFRGALDTLSLWLTKLLLIKVEHFLLKVLIDFTIEDECGTGWAFLLYSKESITDNNKNIQRAQIYLKETNEARNDERFTWDSATAQYERIMQWAFTDLPYVG